MESKGGESGSRVTVDAYTAMRYEEWEPNPCFDDVRLRVSADVLLEGIHEQAESVDCFGWRRMLSQFLPIASVWKR